VDHKTVSRARKTGGEFSPPEKRTGKDGKAYPAKRTSKKPKPTLQAQVNKMARPPIDLVQGYIVELEAWLDTKPPLPEAAVVTLLNALNLCAESCERLTAQIETQFPKGVRKHEATRIPAQ
jgi:hypothetical protein